MKHLKLLTVALLLSNITFSQTLKIQTGTSLSKLNWQVGDGSFEFFNETLVGYSVFASVEYLEKTHFNLSSSIGYLRKGGKDQLNFTTLTGETLFEKDERTKLDYVSINTTIDLKYPVNNKIEPFISIGPRLDYLVGYSSIIEKIEEMDELNKLTYGLNLGGGVRYQLSKIRIGLRTDYYLNFNKIADWPVQPDNLGGEINDKTLLINLSIGYKLK